MEEKKTLKEIIREAGIEGDFACDLCESLYGFGCTKRDHGGRDENCDEDLANELIKAIDREYIERPKFEDGEPVQFGDKFVSPFDSDNYETVAEIAVNSEGRYSLRIADNCGWYAYRPGDRVKRPKPDVLGADGKPIKVGETVWHVVTGMEYVVDGINTDGYQCVTLRKGAARITIDANLITHECPDTLERIQQDAKKHYCEYWGCGDDHCANCHVLIDGKTPADHYKTRDCINAMMQDLLARQRKVLERGQR